jgi:MFS family permease
MSEGSRSAAKPRDWYLVSVLTLAALLSSIDRSVLGLVIGPIKQDFGISDLQASALLGLSFSVLYGGFGILAGHLADRVSRRTLVAGGILVWSAMETACGFARRYIDLLLPRMGLGIGEATLSPASFSMIRDAFPLRQRSLAFGLFQLGPYLGSSVSLILGAALLKLANAGAFTALPFAEGLSAWNWVLICTGVMGLPIALLALTITEPKRLGAGDTQATSFREALRHLGVHWRLHLPLWSAMTLYSMAIGAQSQWLPEAVSRAWRIPLHEVGHMLGLTGCVVAPLGLLVSGRITDLLAGKYGPAAVPRLAMYATAAAAAVTVAFPYLEPRWAFAAYVAQMLLFSGFAVWGATALTIISPVSQLGKLTAFYSIVQVILGLGLGPSVAAFIATVFHSGPYAIAYGVIETFAVCVALGAVMMGWLTREIEQTTS